MAIRFPTCMHAGWKEMLTPVFGNVYIMDPINKLLANDDPTLCPHRSKVFRALRMPPDEVRVIFLALDPYPSPKAANGIAMSAPSMTPTLRSIKQDLEREYDMPQNHFDCSLEQWERAGVLLLNTALTCEAGNTGSHVKQWEPFMKQLLTQIDMYLPNRVWVFLGARARRMGSVVKSNLRFEAHHPAASKYNADLKFELPWKRIAELGFEVNRKQGMIDWGIIPF